VNTELFDALCWLFAGLISPECYLRQAVPEEPLPCPSAKRGQVAAGGTCKNTLVLSQIFTIFATDNTEKNDYKY